MAFTQHDSIILTKQVRQFLEQCFDDAGFVSQIEEENFASALKTKLETDYRCSIQEGCEDRWHDAVQGFVAAVKSQIPEQAVLFGMGSEAQYDSILAWWQADQGMAKSAMQNAFKDLLETFYQTPAAIDFLVAHSRELNREKIAFNDQISECDLEINALTLEIQDQRGDPNAIPQLEEGRVESVENPSLCLLAQVQGQDGEYELVVIGQGDAHALISAMFDREGLPVILQSEMDLGDLVKRRLYKVNRHYRIPQDFEVLWESAVTDCLEQVSSVIPDGSLWGKKYNTIAEWYEVEPDNALNAAEAAFEGIAEKICPAENGALSSLTCKVAKQIEENKKRQQQLEAKEFKKTGLERLRGRLVEERQAQLPVLPEAADLSDEQAIVPVEQPNDVQGNRREVDENQIEADFTRALSIMANNLGDQLNKFAEYVVAFLVYGGDEQATDRIKKTDAGYKTTGVVAVIAAIALGAAGSTGIGLAILFSIAVLAALRTNWVKSKMGEIDNTLQFKLRSEDSGREMVLR